jgi:hypothetical protein
MPVEWASKTVVAGVPFRLPGSSDGGGAGHPSTVFISVTNTVPLSHADPSSLTFSPGQRFAVSNPGDDWIGVSETWLGTDAAGSAASPDGHHYALTWAGGAFNFPAGIFGQDFMAALAAPTGSTVDVVVQTGYTLSDTDLTLDDPPTDLLPPSDLTAAFVTPTDEAPSVHLAWTDNSNNEDGFTIERSLDDFVVTTKVATVPVGTIAFDDYDIALDLAYSYRVFAFNATKRSTNSNVASVFAVYLVAVYPSVGGTYGLDPVVLYGTGFVEGAAVTFDGLAAFDVIFTDARTLSCVVPAHAAGLVDVVVTNPDATQATLTDGFRYTSTVSTPVPHGGPVQTARGPLPSVITTHATITRGLNNGTITYAWVADAANPAATTFGTPTALNTTITFSTYVPGRYRFTVTATDEGGSFAGEDELIIVVPEPTPPRISAGQTGTNLHVGASS